MGGAGGLEHGGGQGGAIGDLVELFGAKISRRTWRERMFFMV